MIPPCPQAALECKAGYEDFEDWNDDSTHTMHSSLPYPEAALECKVKYLQTLTRSGVIDL